MDAAVGIGNGRILPAGPLRELLAAALKRVTAVVLIGDGDCPLPPHIQAVRAHTEPDLPPDFPRDKPFLAFAGIGRPEKFYATCRAAGLTLATTRDFPDHHPFTDNEVAALLRQAEGLNARLLTTEKDWVRLPDAVRAKTQALPIRLVFDGALPLRF